GAVLPRAHERGGEVARAAPHGDPERLSRMWRGVRHEAGSEGVGISRRALPGAPACQPWPRLIHRMCPRHAGCSTPTRHSSPRSVMRAVAASSSPRLLHYAVTRDALDLLDAAGVETFTELAQWDARRLQ